VIRPLFAKARERRGPLTNADWWQAASAELGQEPHVEQEIWWRVASEGLLVPLPDDALGPCFQAVPREFVGYELGFDEEATRAAEDRSIARLRPGGPAEKAGIRERDVLVDAVVSGRADVPVTITVKRGDETKVVKYLPAGSKTKGMRGFARKNDVPEESCAR
jgi:predicted metalloprotease with PDZ domain